MSGPWTLVGNVVQLLDETNKVRVGPGPTPALTLEVNGSARATLQDKGGNVYDVKAFGAMGDGITDDREAVQRAVDAMPAPGPNTLGGGTLFFPPGNYMLSKAPLTDYAVLIQDKPVLVLGAGPEASTLTMTSSDAHTIRTLFTQSGSADRELFTEVRDLKFEVLTPAEQGAFDAIRQECFPAWQNTFLVRNCWFKGVYNCIHLTSIGSAIITDCQFLNPKNAAIFLEQTSLPGSDVGSVFITNCYFFRKPGVTGTGVYGVHATTGVSGVRLHHNVFLGFDHQVLFDLIPQAGHSAVHIDGNLFDGASSSHRIQMTGFGSLSRFNISNNEFAVWGAPGPINGILVDVGTDPVGGASGTLLRGVITDNLFDGFGGAPGGKGIVLTPTGSADCHDVLVSGNVFSNLTTGVEAGANCRRVFVSENVFEEGTVTTPVALDPLSRPPGALFPDRVGVGRANDVTGGVGGPSIVKEIYVHSSQGLRPRIYLQGDPAVSAPGIDFAFDNTNTRRAGIVGKAAGNLGVQLELFTKPDSGSPITRRAVLDAAGNLIWTTPNYMEMIELGDPGAPAADKARLFLQDNGAGKTQLCVRFATGVVVLATQP